MGDELDGGRSKGWMSVRRWGDGLAMGARRRDVPNNELTSSPDDLADRLDDVHGGPVRDDQLAGRRPVALPRGLWPCQGVHLRG